MSKIELPIGWFSGLLALAWSLGAQPGAAQPLPEQVDLTGTVVAEDTGEPVVGAVVILRPPEVPPYQEGNRARSDEAGRFTFQGVQEGTYQLEVRAPDYEDLKQTLIVARETTPVQVVLRPLPGVIGHLRRPDGTPLAQTQVGVYLLFHKITAGRLAPEGLQGWGRNLTTDVAGRYRLALLPPGPSRPSRSSPGLATAVFVVPEVGGGRFSFTVPVGKDVTGPDLTLIPLAAVRGQVRRQDTGKPIAGADVAVRPVAGSSTATETDEAGRFALRNLLSGMLRLTVSAPGYRTYSQRIPAKPGEEVADVICELRPLPSLRGRLRGPDGKPLVGATVQVDLTTPRGSRSHEDEVKTDAEGKFSVLLPPGRQAVRVQVPGAGQALSPWFTVGEEEQEVKMDFVVHSLTVSGVVRNQGNHEPIPDASVGLYRPPEGPWGPQPRFEERGLEAQTDQDGHFLLRDVLPGFYQLWTSTTDFFVASRRPVVVGGRPVEGLVVEMRPEAMLTGRVVGADGVTPVAGATVSDGSQRATTDPEGRFYLTGLAPGPLYLRVQAEGFASIRHRVFVPEAATPGEMTLTLAYRGATLSGQVRDAEGQPLAGALVVAVEQSETPLPNLDSLDEAVQGGQDLPAPWEPQRTDADGRYQFTHLAEGEYRVLALAPGRRPAQRGGVVLKEGEEVSDCDLSLAPLVPEPTAAVRMVPLKLLRPDGTPLAGELIPLRLELQGPDGRTTETESWLDTDENGTLKIPLPQDTAAHLLLRPEDYGCVRREHLERAEGEITIALEEAPPTAIVGRVLRPDGSPAAGVTVVPFIRGRPFRVAAPHAWIFTPGEPYAVGWGWAVDTDAVGRFCLRNLDPGTYGLYFIPPADAEGAAPLPPMLGPWVEAVGPEMDVGEVHLELGGTIRGTAVSDEGQPLPEVAVRVSSGDDSHFVGRFRDATTDAAGRFRVEGLPAGTYRVSAFLPGMVGGFRDDIFVAAGQTVEGLRLQLQRPRYGRLQGQVFRPDGQTPAAQARLWLFPLGGDAVQDWQIAGPDGRFSLDGVEPGRYQVRAWKAGDAPSDPVEVLIQPDQTAAGVQLVLREDGRVQDK